MIPLRVSQRRTKRRTKGGLAMSATDKLRNKVQKLGGRAKETIGRTCGALALQQSLRGSS